MTKQVSNSGKTIWAEVNIGGIDRQDRERGKASRLGASKGGKESSKTRGKISDQKRETARNEAIRLRSTNHKMSLNACADYIFTHRVKLFSISPEDADIGWGAIRDYLKNL